MLLDNEQQQQSEIQMLSAQLFDVDELEERLELTTMTQLDTLCLGNLCTLDTCLGDFNW